MDNVWFLVQKSVYGEWYDRMDDRNEFIWENVPTIDCKWFPFHSYHF